LKLCFDYSGRVTKKKKKNNKKKVEVLEVFKKLLEGLLYPARQLMTRNMLLDRLVTLMMQPRIAAKCVDMTEELEYPGIQFLGRVIGLVIVIVP
jgi:hypothetical protein